MPIDAREPLQRQVDRVQRSDQRRAVRFALRDQLRRTASSASVGSSADTGSSASISVGRLVEHAGDADALQLAAGEPVAAVEQRDRRGRSRASAARAPAASPGSSSEASARQRRPGAEPAGQHRGDDAQPRRDRRALVDHADAARAARRSAAAPELPRVARRAASTRPLARPQRRAERRASGVVLPAPDGPITADALAARRAPARRRCSARWPFGGPGRRRRAHRLIGRDGSPT